MLGGLDSDVFLKLLVAQMKYQDPTNPTDSTAMLAQTAQYTVVEKLSELSTLDQKVLDASNAQSAASMLGRTVTWTDVSGNSRTGVVTATSWGSTTPNLTRRYEHVLPRRRDERRDHAGPGGGRHLDHLTALVTGH